MLVVVDSSEGSLRAVDVGVELAETLDCRLEIIALLDVGAHEVMRRVALAVAPARTREGGGSALPAHSRGLRASLRVVSDHVIGALVDEVKRGDVAFICIDKARKSELERLLLGSARMPTVVVA